MSDFKTVEELYGIDGDKLTILGESNGYWSKCSYFYDQIKSTDASEMTPKQRQWVEKMRDEHEEAFEKIE